MLFKEGGLNVTCSAEDKEVLYHRNLCNIEKYMTDGINKALLSVVNFSRDELEMFQSILKPIAINKGDYFSRAGQICSRVGFITKGILEMTINVGSGNESVLDFFFPGQFVVDYVSYLNGEPAETDIRAIDSATLVVMEHEAIDLLYEKNIRFQQFGRLMAENQFVSFARRIRERSLSPSHRYQKLMSEHTEWIQEIPQYKIASYLNISPEWLSKIRATR